MQKEFASVLPDTNDTALDALQKLLQAMNGIGAASGLLSAATLRQGVLDVSGPPINARYSGASDWTTRTKHFVRVECSNLKLVFFGKYASAGSTPEDTLTNSVTLKCAIETSGGTVIPVYFSGSRTGTLSDGATLVSDSVGLSLSAGDYVWLRIRQEKGASTYHFSNVTIRGTASGSGEGYTTSDYVDSGTIPSADYVGLLPIVVTGDVSIGKSNGVLVVGDSISIGDNDLPESLGWVERATSAYYPLTLLGVGGERASHFVTVSNSDHRLAAAQQGRNRVAICTYGTNDWAAGDSAATIEANLLTIWTRLAALGVRVYQTTITPRPTSTSNNWTTVAGQTAAATDSVRVAVNTYIRTLPAPLAGYLEVADAVESARDSGKWYCPSASSYSGTSAGTTSGTTVTPSGSPGWTTNQWAGYVCRNATAGTVGLIRSNTAGVLTLAASMSFTAGDTVEIWGTYTRDGVHPSMLGYQAIAARVALAVL